MTKEDMEQLRYLQAQIEAIEDSLTSPKSTLVTAFYKDYSTGKGIPKSTTGYDDGEEDAKRLSRELRRDQALLRRRSKETEAFLQDVKETDPLMHTILREFYVNGKTEIEIGEKLGYHNSVISRKIKNFWQMQLANKTK